MLSILRKLSDPETGSHEIPNLFFQISVFFSKTNSTKIHCVFCRAHSTDREKRFNYQLPHRPLSPIISLFHISIRQQSWAFSSRTQSFWNENPVCAHRLAVQTRHRGYVVPSASQLSLFQHHDLIAGDRLPMAKWTPNVCVCVCSPWKSNFCPRCPLPDLDRN